MHALQLIRAFKAEGHDVRSIGDPSLPDVPTYPDTSEGYAEAEAWADVIYVRVDARPMSTWPNLVRALSKTSTPVVWEINSPANENLAYSWLGGREQPQNPLLRRFDWMRRYLHALRQAPAIRREEQLRRALSKNVYACVCVSSGIANYAVEELGISRAFTIPNGADHHFFTPDGPALEIPRIPSIKLRVLYAGSPIYPWQGLGMLRATMKLCEQNGDPIEFVLLMNQESEIDLAGDNVKVFTRVPHVEVPQLMRTADVGVSIQPDFTWSRWGFHGSPMKLFDYMACGLPVVTSSVGQLAEVVSDGHNGATFDNTPEGLREVLLRLSGNPQHLALMGEQARRDVEMQYNWDVIGRRTLGILSDACGQTVTQA